MDVTWDIIDRYFRDNPKCLVRHHLESYNDFFGVGIQQVFREKNPIRLMKQQDPKTKEFNLRCNLFLGGKDGDKLYYGKPVIYDDNNMHFMYPNEARLRNMTYGMAIHYDVDVEFIERNTDTGEITEKFTTLEKIFLGNFPIMVQSKFCILDKLTPDVRFNMGECRNDRGGYYIINGKEKVIVSQEKFADNLLYIKDRGDDIYSYSAEIRMVSEDASKPVRTLSVRIVAPTPASSNNQIVVNIPNVRKPMPLFILMRALGVISDREIIEYCLLDLDKNEDDIDLFIPCVHDAGFIFNQETALKYIATFTKGKTIPHVLDILMNYLLPNVGELNFKSKAYFIGYMVRKLLLVFKGVDKPTDRDSFRFKRVETPGILLYDLFKEYFSLQQRNIFLKMDKEYYYHEGMYQQNFPSLIENNYKEFFKERIVETGLMKAFKGNWGAEAHTKREGVVQDLNRLSFNSFISHLRKVSLPLEASAKIVGPHLLHSSQWGIIDPVDTPDGGNVGLHKHMSIAAHITQSCSGQPMIEWLISQGKLVSLEECTTRFISKNAMVMVNGRWVGMVESPSDLITKIHLFRQLALIPVFFSAHWDRQANSVVVYTDGGRLCRPIYYIEDQIPSVERVRPQVESKKFSWEELLTGFTGKSVKGFSAYDCNIYDFETLYGGDDRDSVIARRGVIQYMDTAEEESALIAMGTGDLGKMPYTHMEIHPSLILGVMGNQIVYPENNQLPRDLFSCGQSKQAVSLYHSNFQTRIDKMGVVLNSGQTPLVKSRYLEYVHNEEHPYGVNAMVAIMCYGGYNVEDAILFNEGSLKRGMFRTTYYNMYESHEESSRVGDSVVDSHFANIESENVSGLRPGYDYSDLDKHGLIREGTLLDDKKVLIGKVTTNLNDPDSSVDDSVVPKKGQLGFVDKSFITEGEEGSRLAKVRIREERIPAIGDKFCSRCGQKGTVGLVIPEEDMPYTEDGMRPDLIVNPHALPSRMTIGQLVETVVGKVGALYGAFGDCTAFVNKGPKHEVFGQLLGEAGFHSTGNQILYNGMTGEQLKTEIFFGPTFYMRLKHMVKDKINYRAQGPRTLMTRQTVQGRANDGGLRVGEMERDGVIAHGAAKFLEESMMKRGDEYYMAVCNQTGTIAVYNNTLNLFLSPLADGPIKFSGALDGNLNIENISRFGRSFSVVRVPYSFKLLMHELQTMNIQMRIITDKNIDQIESMAFSKNIEQLTLIEDVTVRDIIGINSESLQKDNDNTAIRPKKPKRDTRPQMEAVPPPQELQAEPIAEDDDPFASPREVEVARPQPSEDPFAVSDNPSVAKSVDEPLPVISPSYADLVSQSPLPSVSPAYAVQADATSPSYSVQVPPSPAEPSYPAQVPPPAVSPSFEVPTPPPGIEKIVAPTADQSLAQQGPSTRPGSVKATLEIPEGQTSQVTVTANPIAREEPEKSVQVETEPVGDPIITPSESVAGPVSDQSSSQEMNQEGGSTKTIKFG